MQVCRRRSTAYLDPRRIRRKTSHCDRLHSPLIGDETFSASESTFMPRWGPSGIGLLRCHGRTTGARTEQARPISGSGQRRPDSFASTLKVQRSAVGSGSGRHETARPMSQLGRFEPLAHRHPNGRNRRDPVVAGRSGESLLTEPTTDAQPGRRKLLFMPLCCHCRCP